ncbi:hypothetical protein NA66_100318 [Burkholderia pyrrocinia]|uniref:Uncharacterized protein n=1 Tax=Burkholderia pyrrocinia TaxID=60550 RepID=A0A318ITX1_BURPY|nr:hypothetical protein NA66_100318 [Burkholderia pyrrocinia]SFW51927.1 hypothetical protein SAMN03159384_02560 [Burkholderia sp. NFACC33-1]SFX61852.1 hypothetical protein SAMN03159408_01801 [Burkholderia sp. NFPP32]
MRLRTSAVGTLPYEPDGTDRRVASVPVLNSFQIGKQAVEFSPDHAVAFAHTLFEPGAIQYLDVSIVGADQSGILKFQRSFRHALPSDTEHVGDQLLRHFQFARWQPVETEQQPAAQLLID